MYKKSPLIPVKGPKDFGGTTLISNSCMPEKIALSSSLNAGSTLHFTCTELRGRFHDSRTESSHHMDSSLRLLLMYYSLHCHFIYLICSLSLVYFMRNFPICQVAKQKIPRQKTARVTIHRICFVRVLFYYFNVNKLSITSFFSNWLLYSRIL